jgi:hypothetical protein
MAEPRKKKSDSKAPKRPPGRPSKYTPEVIASLKESLELGLFHEQACLRAEISRETFHRWQEEKPEFCDMIQKAEGDCEAHHLKRIHDGVPQWQSSGWFLERKYRERWYQAKEVEVKGLPELFTESYKTWQDTVPQPSKDEQGKPLKAN